MRSMYGYILTYSGFKGRTFKLCVLDRQDFNFCICSSPLQGNVRGKVKSHKPKLLRSQDS